MLSPKKVELSSIIASSNFVVKVKKIPKSTTEFRVLEILKGAHKQFNDNKNEFRKVVIKMH